MNVALANPFDPEEAIPKSAELLADRASSVSAILASPPPLTTPVLPAVANWLAGHAQFAGRDGGLRSDAITRLPVEELDWQRRGGNDNRQRNILEAIRNYKRQPPFAAQNLAPLPPRRSLRRGASSSPASFFEGGGAGRLHARAEQQLFRNNWQDRTHGHRRSRAQPRFAPYYPVRAPAPSKRAAADTICEKILRAGGACVALRS